MLESRGARFHRALSGSPGRGTGWLCVTPHNKQKGGVFLECASKMTWQRANKRRKKSKQGFDFFFFMYLYEIHKPEHRTPGQDTEVQVRGGDG